ncbi:MAG: pyridoxamine 5'-phosphate oxidase family protein [candidate division WOR-3 bacterium]|nr:pyridoxamine 5'-phosphate oxidase family protein [candidate division WOR-3 bacterium]
MKKIVMLSYFATCDGNKPVIRPVSPIIENDLSIWITTFSNFRKIKQVKKNSNNCLAFVEYVHDNKLAIVYGKAKIVNDSKQKRRIGNIASFNLKEYFPDGPRSKDYCLVKININRIEWRKGWERTKIYKPE